MIERPHHYAPLFAVDEHNNDIIWELWIEAVEQAVKLRPAARQQLLLAAPDTARAIAGLLALSDVAGQDSAFSQDKFGALTEAAPDEIGPRAVTLHGWRLANYEPVHTDCRIL